MYRKFIFFFVAVSLIFSIHAISQTSQGDKTYGGALGYSRQFSGTPTNSSSISFEPMFGYCIFNHLMLGGSLTLSPSFGSRRGRTTNGGLRAGPFLRYYFKNKIFVQADYNFGLAGRAGFENDVFLRTGYSFFHNKNFAIEPQFIFGERYISTRRGRFNYFSAPSNYWLDNIGIYVSFQIYIESAFNKLPKKRNGVMTPKQKSFP